MAVRGLLDDMHEETLRRKLAREKTNSRQATSRESNEMRERFQESARKRKDRVQKTKQKSLSMGGDLDDGEEQEDDGKTQIGRRRIDLSKYEIVHRKDGSRLGVPKKLMWRSTEDGKKEMNIGVFGKGEMQWYELWLSQRPTSIQKNFE
eukprot:CAMPEP_0114491000 /NCGR_PEP_ID=MMETSP0109-20121206/2759_1 /TAXON_ID=29199 /ORGANISM="Chlorarachnion reptans, Strain CCCM449" /LENGTH=148 /DNA_ID=CAMNT_0001667689 /DNA_START=229 /DNA_END=672 /DNA_ORIENTATION=-